MSAEARVLWKRALLATLVHLALLFAWPAVKPVYAPLFRASAELAVGFLDPLPGPIDARFEPGSGGLLAMNVPSMDTAVYLRHRELEGADASFGASSFFHAYVSTTVLLALFAAATPLAWRARRWRLVWALALLHLFFALRCALAVFHCYAKCNVDGKPLVELGPFATRALELTWHFSFNEDFTNYLAPIVLWAVFVFGARPADEAGA